MAANTLLVAFRRARRRESKMQKIVLTLPQKRTHRIVYFDCLLDEGKKLNFHFLVVGPRIESPSPFSDAARAGARAVQRTGLFSHECAPLWSWSHGEGVGSE
jgi:hypothetical protein